MRRGKRKRKKTIDRASSKSNSLKSANEKRVEKKVERKDERGGGIIITFISQFKIGYLFIICICTPKSAIITISQNSLQRTQGKKRGRRRGKREKREKKKKERKGRDNNLHLSIQNLLFVRHIHLYTQVDNNYFRLKFPQSTQEKREKREKREEREGEKGKKERKREKEKKERGG